MEKFTVTFLRDFDYHHGRATISYRAGSTYEVDAQTAAFAMDQGAAVQDESDPVFEPDFDEVIEVESDPFDTLFQDEAED